MLGRHGLGRQSPPCGLGVPMTRCAYAAVARWAVDGAHQSASRLMAGAASMIGMPGLAEVRRRFKPTDFGAAVKPRAVSDQQPALLVKMHLVPHRKPLAHTAASTVPRRVQPVGAINVGRPVGRAWRLSCTVLTFDLLLRKGVARFAAAGRGDPVADGGLFVIGWVHDSLIRLPDAPNPVQTAAIAATNRKEVIQCLIVPWCT